MGREDDVRRAIEVFAALNLPDWAEEKAKPRAGGQATVLIVRRRDGVLGVFRFLRSDDPIHVRRFFREVDLLTKPDFRHDGIIELLEWTTDGKTPWYISRLGRSFEDWWEDYRARHESTPTLVVAKATEVLLTITEGLAPLHDAGCVHRDIKPPNIVVNGRGEDAVPVMIDFGVAYVEGAERLTDPDEAVGNARFSPDVAMNRMDEVPPWLDVFQLSQLLMWMVAIRPAKDHWNRPVDSRWVNYPDGLPPETVSALRAVTASCSEQALAPKNARELNKLLRERFPAAPAQSAAAGGFQFNVQAIQTATAAGKSELDLSVANDHRLVVSARPDAERFYAELEPKLDALIAAAQEQGVDCKRMGCETLGQYLDELLKVRNRMNSGQAYEIQCGKFGTPATFTVSIGVYVFIPGRLHDWPPLPETSSPIVFYICAHGNVVHSPFPGSDVRVTLERDGKYTLRTHRMQPIREITIDDLVLEIKAAMENPKA